MRRAFLLSVSIIFFLGIFAPMGALFVRITPESFAQVIQSPQFFDALQNSVSTGLIATIIAMVLSLTAAWSLERIAIRGKEIFTIIFGIPMLIPSISHSFGLVALFGATVG